MFSYILDALNNWFENDERSRREAFLASSSDLVELEYRIRALDHNGYRVL